MQIQTISARKTLALVVLAASSVFLVPSSFAQSAGDFIVSAGWFHISPQDSSTPLRATSSSTSFSQVLPGSGASIEPMDTIGLSLGYFITDHWAASFDLGIPPKYKLNGAGTLAGVGQIGTATQWAPALLGKYYFGDAKAKFRPSLGLGVTHVNYTSIQLNQGFQRYVGNLFLDPSAKTSAEIDSSWAPIFNAGISYEFTDNWYANLSVSYLRLRSNGTLTTPTNGPLGTVTSRTTLTINPIVTYLNVGYRF
jgi:outer membrane protein